MVYQYHPLAICSIAVSTYKHLCKSIFLLRLILIIQNFNIPLQPLRFYFSVQFQSSNHYSPYIVVIVIVTLTMSSCAWAYLFDCQFDKQHLLFEIRSKAT